MMEPPREKTKDAPDDRRNRATESTVGAALRGLARILAHQAARDQFGNLQTPRPDCPASEKEKPHGQ
jgi:hypothetical protein